MRALEGSGYHLGRALPSWHRRGDTSIFRGADKCVRVDPVEDGITGFFVALFVRNDLSEGWEDGDNEEDAGSGSWNTKGNRNKRGRGGRKGGRNMNSPVPAKKPAVGPKITRFDED